MEEAVGPGSRHRSLVDPQMKQQHDSQPFRVCWSGLDSPSGVLKSLGRGSQHGLELVLRPAFPPFAGTKNTCTICLLPFAVLVEKGCLFGGEKHGLQCLSKYMDMLQSNH